MRSKIAVVGEKASVMGFRAVGFEVFEVQDAATETEQIIDRLTKDGYGVVFITEQALSDAMHVMDKYKNSKLPAIIPIPGRDGTMGIGMTNLHKSVERAVGADILFNND